MDIEIKRCPQCRKTYDKDAILCPFDTSPLLLEVVDSDALADALQGTQGKQNGLTPLLDVLLARAGNDVGVDIYDFRAGLRNDGPKPVRNFRLEVEVPNTYANLSHSSVAEVREHRRADVTLYRRAARELGRNFELYPDETRDVALSLDFQVTFEQYREGVSGNITVILYDDDVEVSRIDHPIADMLNQERVQKILGGQ